MILKPRQSTLAATSLGSSLAFIDATAVTVALPTIQSQLHLGLHGIQWVFLSYSIALAALYLIGGAIGDRYGHQKVFALGVVGFALASALVGVSPNSAWMIASRVLQGIFGALVTTNSLAWLRKAYGDSAGRAVGLWTSLTSISIVIAPPLGGALTQWLSWRWIFFINLPLAALVLYWSAQATKDKPERKNAKLDIPGSVLIATALSFIVYYLVQGAETGFEHLSWALLAGIGALIGFIVTELRARQPMLPLNLFKIRNFTLVNLATFFVYGALNSLLFFSLYLQFLGLSPLAASLFYIPTSIVMILLAPYFGGLADRIGPKLLLIIGPGLIGIGTLFFTLITAKANVWLWGGVGIAFFSLGLAIMVAPITTLALKSVPVSFSGLASGTNNTMARVGGLVAVAVVGMVISLVFFSDVSDRSAVPLDLHQSQPALRLASTKAFRYGTYMVAGLAFLGAAISLGLSNLKKAKTSQGK
ncbi:MFS transporter [Candidatus Saccharibacteria bacterium]|nr:MFS transporter [Candidatus Saccharibacteria bacterium]